MQCSFVSDHFSWHFNKAMGLGTISISTDHVTFSQSVLSTFFFFFCVLAVPFVCEGFVLM